MFICNLTCFLASNQVEMQNKDDWYYIEKVIKGESASYAPLVDRYKEMAYNISLRIVRRPEDAEEITQDAFVKAYRSLKGFKGDAKFSTWLYRIVYNSSVSHIRRKQRLGIADSKSIDRLRIEDTAEESDQQNDELMVSALKKATDSLPAEEQTLITLYYYDDKSIDEIAGIMNLSVSNVKVKLFRTRKKLHDLIRKISKYSRYEKSK